MSETKYIPRMKTFYKEKVVSTLQDEFKFKNAMQVPRIEKVIVSSTTKDAVSNAKVLDKIAQELGMITGQKPVITRARNSIAGFKLREGMPIGTKVTLRNTQMYEFLDRLINVALPRTKDFKGCDPDAFDGRGTYNLGVKEQIIFPEISYDKVDKIRGMNVTIVTSAPDNIQARSLLKAFGFPFRSSK